MNQGVLATVKVRTYIKDDGTVVHEHDRHIPYSGIKGDSLINGKEGKLTEQQIKKYSKLIGLPDSIKGDLLLNDQEITFVGEGVEMTRSLGQDGIFLNDNFTIDKDSIWKGQGSYFFERQVDALKKAGYRGIKTIAAKSPEENGYYTWLRLGYAPSDNPSIDKFASAIKDVYGKVDKKLIRSATSDPKFMKYWLKNGSSFTGTFNLSDNSYSMNTLKDYNSFKRKTKPEKL